MEPTPPSHPSDPPPTVQEGGWRTPRHATPATEQQQQQQQQEPHQGYDDAAATAADSISGNDPRLGPQHVTDAPPFWSTRHGRSVSTVSYHSILQDRPAAIALEDHSQEHDHQAQGCWARSVTINEYVVVSGPTGIGAYVVWHCTVSTLKGGDLEIRKRYSEFDQLRSDLVRSFPHAAAMIPQLPRKSVVSRFRPKFLEQRKQGLTHFMNCILLNPEFAASPVLKEFIIS